MSSEQEKGPQYNNYKSSLQKLQENPKIINS